MCLHSRGYTINHNENEDENFDLELETKIEKMCQYDTAYVY